MDETQFLLQAIHRNIASSWELRIGVRAGGQNYIERFQRSLKEEEVWTVEDRNPQQARVSVAR